MEFDTDADGNPISRFAAALAGRHLDLMGSAGGSHPLQRLAPASSIVGDSLQILLDELGGLPFSLRGPLNAGGVLQAYRRLTYDATELFDLFSQMIPSRLPQRDAGAKRDVADYVRVAKRLRGPWAALCNKFKHNGSQLAFTGGTSTVDGALAVGYILLSPKDGRAMIRDEDVHPGIERQASFVRKAHELLHAILRTDAAAAKLVNALSDDAAAPAMPDRTVTYPFGSSMKRLAAMPRTVMNEPRQFDGIVVEPGRVRLERTVGAPLRGQVDFTTQIDGDGHSDIFSFG